MHFIFKTIDNKYFLFDKFPLNKIEKNLLNLKDLFTIK